MKIRIHPVTRRRLARFRECRRAWWSFWILAALYGASLAAELISNSRPYYARMGDRAFFPILIDYSQHDILGNGVMTRPDYTALREARPDARIIFAPIRYGPLDIVRRDTIRLPNVVTATFQPEERAATYDLRPDLSVARAVGADVFESIDFVNVDGLRDAVAARMKNETAPPYERTLSDKNTIISMPAFAPRSQAPKTARVTVRDAVPTSESFRVDFDGKLATDSEKWRAWPDESKSLILEAARAGFDGVADPVTVQREGTTYRVSFEREQVRYPFRPVQGHPLGIDSAGRDVLARIIYGFRTSISFGLLLVAAAMTMGTLIGAIQGYFGGRWDLFGQRFTEIWENLPFLYVIMLLGSVFGRSLTLLLVCYGLFNWIGISNYMRAEFLKLRKQSFVEGALCLGLPSRRIMFRHILPNALVPITTFAPFSLIGAVSALAALDFLGFGLPPPTPSWGELLAQAQEFKWAWWLVVYPGLALFVVILLCVFIGEGVREAFDPRRASRLE